MQFHECGPVAVPDEVFQAYQQLFPTQVVDTKDLFAIWINENYDDHLRRLALRDMLRQGDKLSDGDIYYCAFSSDVTSIFKCARSSNTAQDGKERLAELLRTRPKLLEELVDELSWGRTENGVCIAQIAPSKAKDRLIEFLLPLIDETAGRKLWRQYSHLSDADNSDRLARLELWDDLGGQPEWLDKELRQEVFVSLQREITEHREILQGCRKFSDYPHDQMSEVIVLLWAIQLADNRACPTYGQTLGHFVEIVHMLNQLLPDTFHYLNFETLCEVMPKLDDMQLVLETCRRHLMSYDDIWPMQRVAQQQALRFLYWLLGCAVMCAAKDRAFQAKIKKFIRQISAYPEAFKSDSH